MLSLADALPRPELPLPSAPPEEPSEAPPPDDAPPDDAPPVDGVGIPVGIDAPLGIPIPPVVVPALPELPPFAEPP